MTPLPERICTHSVAERIGVALELVPARVLERIGPCPVFEGDAVFSGYDRDAGEYSYEWYGETRAARYRDSAQCFHRRERSGRYVSAVKLPWAGAGYDGSYLVGTVLHEMGHALWNTIVKSYERDRVFWSRGERQVIRNSSSGLVPSMMPFSGYQPKSMTEQFAEAFRIWLSPYWLRSAAWEPEQFFLRSKSETVDHWGVRTDNRRLLAWLNELAGWPGDRPPRAFLDDAVL